MALMTYCVDDTIVALASPPGGAVRGVVRISGNGTLSCLLKCFRPDGPGELTEVRHPTVVAGHLQLADPLGPLPGHLYWWPTCRSYTRQVAAEWHTVGSPPLLDAVVHTLCQCGARLARPGEFTLRAFLAGRLDLTQAEAVLGVIEAQDTRTLETALTQLAGGLAGPLADIRSDLLDLLADLEAGLDFVEEDLAFVSASEVERRLREATLSVDGILARISSRSDATRQPRVVLRGWPNVGKSSLLNALTGDHVAIVFHEAGTTRDYVTRAFQWQGIAGVLVDTAGLEEHAGPDLLASAAQQLGQSQHEQADLELLCLDATRPLHEQEHSMLRQGRDRNRLVVWTKSDQGNIHPRAGDDEFVGICTSSRTGEGIELLRRRICDRLATTTAPPTLVVASTAERCRQSLLQAAQHLQKSRELVARHLGEELVAWELRATLQQLGEIVGAVYTDDILDRVFSRFCIGK